jgi:DmsA/YnfE family anaerobic dimethyl sulfoxide reductase A subunit
MSKKTKGQQLSRRTFVKGSALAALATAAGTGALSSLYGCSTPAPDDTGGGVETSVVADKIAWSTCAGEGCGFNLCPLQFHTENGIITYVEGDTLGSPAFGDLQARACLRGRSIRRWINSPDRLQYPMKRVGKRGDAEFERISWDEAIALLVEKYRYTIDTYGNEAIFSNYGSGNNGRPFERFNNLTGGRLEHYGSDTCGQTEMTLPFIYGPGVLWGSPITTAIADADLIVLFGNSPSDTRMGGGSGTYDIAMARAAGVKIVNIDYRLNETASGFPDEWLPIRLGTDGALASAINHVLINEGFADEAFLNEYCVGYDEKTMPASAQPNSSYKDYILGTGYDMIAKTPEWAAPITQIPAEKIYKLAREIGNAKAAYITQGFGPQRHSNGENALRAIAMISVISGNVGLPGTTAGLKEPVATGPMMGFPGGKNPIETTISVVNRIDAIEFGEKMTALRNGVKGKEKLDTGIKFLINIATNTLVNQHNNINHTHDVLVDESLCEFIVVVDVVLCNSARYADLLLPDLMTQERPMIQNLKCAGASEAIVFSQPIQEPQFECRDWYDVVVELADAFGVKEEFTDGGKTWEDWNYSLYEQAREARPDLPTLEEGYEMGLWKQKIPPNVALEAFRKDPKANPLATPSGKIEIYSEDIAQIAATWELDDSRDIISPIGIYNPGVESFEDATEEYPLLLSGWHPKSRYHSSFAVVENLEQAVRHQAWINTIDAKVRGIANGDMIRVFNERGEVHIEARVTPRIVPGTVGIPEGSWHNADMDGDRIDKGGNVNVLTSSHWSPLAKHNPSHNSIIQVEKI